MFLCLTSPFDGGSLFGLHWSRLVGLLALAVDLSDPIPDLAKLTTWIDWLEAENGTPDHVAHFFG